MTTKIDKQKLIQHTEDKILSLLASCYCYALSQQKKPCQNCETAEHMKRILSLLRGDE